MMLAVEGRKALAASKAMDTVSIVFPYGRLFDVEHGIVLLQRGILEAFQLHGIVIVLDNLVAWILLERMSPTLYELEHFIFNQIRF